MRIKVYKDDLDWMFRCDEHDETGFAGSWEWALEMAYGHAAMFHPCTEAEWKRYMKYGRDLSVIASDIWAKMTGFA